MQELDSLVKTVRIFSSDMEMQIGISKCAMLEMKKLCKVKEYSYRMVKG